MKSIVDHELSPKSHAHQFGFRFKTVLRASRLRPGPSFIRVAPCSTVSRGRQTQDARARKVPLLKKAASGKASARARCFLYTMLVGIAEYLSSAMWGFRGRLKNTRQVPAARAFVSNQTGLMEERGDACDLGHLCCFASRTQQGSSGALTRHRLLHGGAPPSSSSVLP